MTALPDRSHPSTSTVPPEIIRTERLSKTYPGGMAAVDELDLSVKRGEIFGLLGPNGAGKTTTVGMLTTRVVPTAGRAMVGGIDVVAEPTRVKQHIGVVSQTNSLDRRLTVWENLYFHGRYFAMGARKARAAADEMLEAFGLAHRAKSKVHALSGGMARRLMLARAILHQPAVIFLDEPTAGLDPQSRIALWEVMRRLNADGRTILLTTHYMEEADRLCHRVAIMDDGRILALGSPAALKANLGERRAVVGKGEGLRDRLAERLTRVLSGEGPKSSGKRLPLPPSSDGVTPDLETVFINLTGKALRE